MKPSVAAARAGRRGRLQSAPRARAGRLNRRSARRVAARRRARTLAERAEAALVWVRQSFAMREERNVPLVGGAQGRLQHDRLPLSLQTLSLDDLSPSVKAKFTASAAAATSAASYRRAITSVQARCERFSKSCGPHKASDRGAQGPNPNTAAGATARHAIAVHALTIESALKPVSVSGTAAAPSARSIVADLLSLPRSAATVDLLDALPAHRRAQYANKEPTLWRAEQSNTGTAARPQKPPKPCTLTSAAEWAKALMLMWTAGMIAFPREITALCGVFAVDKPDGRLRAITDARPANWCFAEPDHTTLPTPDLLARIRIPPGAVAYVARTDAADFYHTFRTPEWMWPYFGLPPVRVRDLSPSAREELERVHGAVSDDDWARPALRTLPMG
jgi:hypothetical protein